MCRLKRKLYNFNWLYDQIKELDMSYKTTIKNIITRSYKLFMPKDNGLRVFMYHSVQDNPTNLNDIYTISSKLFTEQMMLLKTKYQTNISRLKNLEILEREVTLAITFDDGYSDNLHVATPILQDLELPYTVFVTTDFIKNKKKGFLTSNELKELASYSNVDVGSHTSSHPHLTTLNNKQIMEELSSSKKFLEDLLSKEITMFAYPHGDYDQRVRDLVCEAGYKIARNSKFSANKIIEDRFLVSSSEIWNTDSIKVFQDKIDGYWDWLKLVQR